MCYTVFDLQKTSKNFNTEVFFSTLNGFFINQAIVSKNVKNSPSDRRNIFLEIDKIGF